MFKKSRRKIIAAIMGILLLVLFSSLAVIYLTSYIQVRNRNMDAIARYISIFEENGKLGSERMEQEPPETEGSQPENEPQMREETDDGSLPSLSLFTMYAAVLDEEGNAVSVDIGDKNQISEETLRKVAQQIQKKGKQKGTFGNYLYRMQQIGNETIVVLMDNTILRDSITTLFQNTLILGGGMLLLCFGAAIFLSGKIIAPLEIQYQKQRQFLSDASHELKTPVAVIATNIEMQKREYGTTKWLQNIGYENERMRGLLTELLELARTEQVRAEHELLDFSRLVEGELLPFESTAYEAGVTLTSRLEEQIQINGNRMQLAQLVGVLTDNAIRHATKGTEVKVRLWKEHRSIRLSVSNVGTEIGKEEREHLFERFYRGDEARSGEGRHYGLGLAIAKAVAEAHKGKIEVDCSAGVTTFTVSLQNS